MDETLKLEVRRKIYNFIEKNPGLHLSSIAKLLKMRISHVEYHLLFLEKAQVVYSVKDSGYTRYFVKGKIPVKNKKTLAIMRQEVPLRILLYLLINERSRHKDIIKNLEVAPSTLSYHLHKLVNQGIIEVHKSESEQGYSLVNRREIIQLLIQYKPYDLFEGFRDVWFDLNVD